MITPEQEKLARARYTRSLLEAVDEPRRLRLEKAQQLRRHNRLLKEKKDAEKNA